MNLTRIHRTHMQQTISLSDSLWNQSFFGHISDRSPSLVNITQIDPSVQVHLEDLIAYIAVCFLGSSGKQCEMQRGRRYRCTCICLWSAISTGTSIWNELWMCLENYIYIYCFGPMPTQSKHTQTLTPFPFAIFRLSDSDSDSSDSDIERHRGLNSWDL